MRIRKPVAAIAAAGRSDRSIELVCLALVLALVTLAVRIVGVL
jgi:hypothetical protein